MFMLEEYMYILERIISVFLDGILDYIIVSTIEPIYTIKDISSDHRIIPV